jgi:gas vesicle protein
MIAVSSLSPFALAIKSLYGVAVELNAFIDEHIESMKSSANSTISRTGSVLEGAKYGFGLGYMSSVIIIAGGQLLLGNTLAAVSEVATAAALSNPMAMTCAAVGAIYFGWNALSDQERESILEKLSEGVQVGKELIKSVFAYVINWFKSVNDSVFLKELKDDIRDVAVIFHKSLSDVTKSAADTADEIFKTVSETASKIGDGVKDAVKTVRDKVKPKSNDS